MSAAEAGCAVAGSRGIALRRRAWSARRAAAFLAALILTLSEGGVGAGAQESPPSDCATAMTQAALNDCAARGFAEADDALNAAWGPAMGWARRMDARMREEAAAGTLIGPPVFGGLAEGQSLADGLLDAQRGWLRYRDGQCTAEAATFTGGSIWPMLFDGCRAALTRVRTEELLALPLPPDGQDR